MGAHHSVRCASNNVTQMSPLVRDMHLAVMRNDVPSLEYCLSHGCDINAVWYNAATSTAKNGCTALIQAVALNHVDIVKCLLANNDIEVDKADFHGVTPLMKAAYHGRARIAELLIDAGARMDDTDADGNTVLQQCVKYGSVHGGWACVAALLQRGAPVNHRNRVGLTAMHLVAANGETTMVAWLLAASADRDVVDANNCTPLWHCVKHVIEQERRAPSSWLHTSLRHRASMLRMLLVNAHVDSLGFATWLLRISKTNTQLVEQMHLSHWVHSHQPESLKHLCRVRIQSLLAFTPIRHQYCCRKIKQLQLPVELRTYLARRVFPT